MRVGMCKLVAVVLVSWSGVVLASPAITLSSPSDLMSIPVGETVRVDVRLEGLEAGVKLRSLVAESMWEASLLGETTEPLGGSIVPPVLTDPGGLQLTSGEGIAIGDFFSSSSVAANLIGTNGTFYSFQVRGVAPGDGSLVVSFAHGRAFDASAPNGVPIAVDSGAPVPFRVVVPEPTALATVAATAAVVLRRRR